MKLPSRPLINLQVFIRNLTPPPPSPYPLDHCTSIQGVINENGGNHDFTFTSVLEIKAPLFTVLSYLEVA